MRGKICLVTGGAEGIGKATALEFLENGAKVIICDINEPLGNETFQEFRDKFGEDHVEFYTCDVSDSSQLEAIFKRGIEKFGALDVLVNNAGICKKCEAWKKMIDINLGGTICGTQLAFHYMSKKNGGRGGTVVNIGSIAALDPYPYLSVYSATKSAVNQYTRSVGTDAFFSESGVKVILVNPGKTLTRILDCIKDFPAEIVALSESVPSQTPDYVGKTVVELIKSAPNGSLWTLEGGQKTPTILK